jgi:LysR family positive regulator for ilvC
MDSRRLKQFVALAGSLHFGRAAEATNVSPSALSRSIQRLEEELGVALFERNNRSVSLTDAGHRFLPYARDSLRDWDSIRNRLMAESGEVHGEVSLYCSVTASYSFLFDILAEVRRKYPRIEIKLHTGDPEDAIGRVLSGSEDIAIAARPRRLHAGLAFRRIDVSPLVFICARSHPAPHDWKNCPMILNERGLARERVDRWFRDKGLRPSIYAQVAGNEAIVSMVSLGFGIGVVPRIKPDLAPYEVGLVTQEKKLTSPLIDAFWAAAKD